MNERLQAQRPLRDLLQTLPRLPMLDSQVIDFAAADAEVLVAIADNAEITVNVIQQGVGAIGHLLAASAVDLEDGTISADYIESIGFLLAELGDAGAHFMTLAAQCRHETHEYRLYLRKSISSIQIKERQ